MGKWKYTHLSDGREPDCIHDSEFPQPMSMCVECQHHPKLIEWRQYWSDMDVLFNCGLCGKPKHTDPCTPGTSKKVLDWAESVNEQNREQGYA